MFAVVLIFFIKYAVVAQLVEHVIGYRIAHL